jgi:hypothetical protein
MRISLFVALLGTIFYPPGCLLGASRGEIIPETSAQRHGLTRPWLTQVQVDRARGRVRDVVLYEGVLYVQTDRAVIHAIDAETGQSLWAKQVGRPEHPSMTPSASHDLLGTVNGSRLYVMNRYTGDVLYETEVNGAPGAGVALSGKYAYVPMVSGMVMAYRLEPITDPMKELGKIKTQEGTPEERKAQEKAEAEERRQNIRLKQEYVPPLACQSAGRIVVQPLVTYEDRNEEFLAWVTDKGYLNVGRIDRRQSDSFVIKYRLLTGESIAAQPTYLPPDPKVVGDSGTIFAASRDGYVYAVTEKSGDLAWKFSMADPLVEPAVVIEDKVYASAQAGGLYCLDAKTGKQQWLAPEITRFLAAGKERLYVSDKLGRTLVLDAKTGGRIDVLPTEMLPIKVTNAQTDRLYLGTDTGLLQCLHEAEQTQPILYGESRKPPKEEENEKPKPGPKAKKAPADAPGDDLGGGEKPKAKPKAVPKERPAPKVREPKEAKEPKPRTPKRTTGHGKAKMGDDADGGLDAGADDSGMGNGKASKKRRPVRDKVLPRAKGKAGKGKAGGDDGGDGGDGGDAAKNPFG